jgi:shikimate kinase / 3-dehydroquinate synthase
VISTGGGALASPENADAMVEHGLVVCLSCSMDEMWHRLRNSGNRPMLYASDRRARIEELLVARKPAYDRIPYQLETTGISIQEAARRVVALWEDAERTIPVQAPDSEYAIHLGEGVLGRAGELLRAAGISGTIGLVSNDVVGPLHASALERTLREAGYDVASVWVPDGEEHKRLDTVRVLYDDFVESGMARDSAVLALGGGVVGDMAGLAAATFMRGIDLIQAPTTLLSMVDSSVGGKVAVDHPAGKNLIGAFKQPRLVMADTATLCTLPEEEYRSGLAEVIKAGIIDSPALFDHFERGQRGDAAWPIAEAIRVKIDVVEEDPYEHGRRAVLNLGHTFGHALELLKDFQMRHGEAVSIGMIIASRVSEVLGLAEAGLAERIQACLELHGLRTDLPSLDAEAIWEGMGSDKKKRAGKLRFVLPRAIGDVIVTDEVPRQAVLEVLEKMRSEGEEQRR